MISRSSASRRSSGRGTTSRRSSPTSAAGPNAARGNHKGGIMDFKLSEEQQMVVDGAKKFAEKELAPVVMELDEKQEPNLTALKALGELGYLGMTVPEE